MPKKIKTKEMKSIAEIRKAVATLANSINRKLKDLSAAFKRAWLIVKGKSVLSKVTGVTYNGIQKALSRLTKYNPQVVSVELVREPKNQYDIYSVGVHVSVNRSTAYQIGYLPRDLAQCISGVMDNEIKLTAAFKGITGGIQDKYYYGALIEIQF